jgi:hypothetical protein
MPLSCVGLLVCAVLPLVLWTRADANCTGRGQVPTAYGVWMSRRCAVSLGVGAAATEAAAPTRHQLEVSQ